ncbi:MAG: hypothetical protein PHP02_06030 [Eubacteriales bacterium]|nr:hypothetical protein [Eubacteriales bacterium]
MEDTEKQAQELEQQLEALLAREAEVARKERTLRAREALDEAGLPLKILVHLNLTSDEALENSLTLAKELSQLQANPGPGTPKAGIARLPRDASYAQRALLYQTDRNAWHEQYNKGEER